MHDIARTTQVLPKRRCQCQPPEGTALPKSVSACLASWATTSSTERIEPHLEDGPIPVTAPHLAEMIIIQALEQADT